MNLEIKTLRNGLTVMTALVFTALFLMHYFHEGTALSKYLTKQIELERVKEKEVVAYTDMALFGDPLVEVDGGVDLKEQGSEEEGFLATERIRRVDRGVLMGLLVAAWLMMIPQLQRVRWLSSVYVVMGLYIFLLAVAKSLNGGAAFSEWSVFAHGTRWIPCLALWWIYQRGDKAGKTVKWLLIIATSLTFVTHGVEAWLLHPSFRDLLIGGFSSIGLQLEESWCQILLGSIGVMDVGLALLILFWQRRELFLWMAIWGGLTALSRPISSENILWVDALLRCGNCLVPLILFWWVNHEEKITTKNYEEKNI